MEQLRREIDLIITKYNLINQALLDVALYLKAKPNKTEGDKRELDKIEGIFKALREDL